MAEPWGSISGMLCSGTGAESAELKETPAHRKLWTAQGGGLGCSTTLLSPLCTAVPCGKLEKPLSPQHRAPKAALPLCAGQGAAGAMGWDGMGSMSDIKHPQGPLGDSWAVLTCPASQHGHTGSCLSCAGSR